MRVVLVDDDAAVRSSLKLVLTSRGYDVETYTGGEAALDARLGSSTRCLIADYLMSDIDGLRLIERLRNQGWQGVALLITGHFDASLERRAHAAGYAHVFEKPLNHTRLLNAVAQVRDAN